MLSAFPLLEKLLKRDTDRTYTFKIGSFIFYRPTSVSAVIMFANASLSGLSICLYSTSLLLIQIHRIAFYWLSHLLTRTHNLVNQ